MPFMNTATKINSFVSNSGSGGLKKPEFNVEGVCTGSLVQVRDDSNYHPKQLSHLSNHAKWSSNNFYGRVVSVSKERMKIRRSDGHLKTVIPAIHHVSTVSDSYGIFLMSKDRGLLPTAKQGHFFEKELSIALKNNSFKVAVTGAKLFGDYSILEQKLDKLLSNIVSSNVVIISSGQQGAELLAELYAHQHNFIVLRVQNVSDLVEDEASAKNADHLTRQADACVVFFPDESTSQVIQTSKSRGIPLRLVKTFKS